MNAEAWTATEGAVDRRVAGRPVAGNRGGAALACGRSVDLDLPPDGTGDRGDSAPHVLRTREAHPTPGVTRTADRGRRIARRAIDGSGSRSAADRNLFDGQGRRDEGLRDG